MTLEQRIEAAAKALNDSKANTGEWETALPDFQDYQRYEAVGILMAAFPELFTTPPTAWIAPWEATKTELDSAFRAERYDEGHGTRQGLWSALRAHLSPSPQGNTPRE